MPLPVGTSVAGTSPRAKVIRADLLGDAVVTGKSTKAHVAAALGETQVISFGSGFEVWVYRISGDTPARASAEGGGAGSQQAMPGTSAEFVILFAPSGVVAKTRVRPAPQRRHGNAG